MVANEVNKFGQIFANSLALEIQGYRVISILLISPPKVIYAELFCVKDTPHFFFQTYIRITLYIMPNCINCLYFRTSLYPEGT
jgi:hypothetical protein